MTKDKACDAPESVMVVGAQLNGLGVVRSLAKGGMPIIVVGKSLQHAALWSRWSTRHIVSQLFGQPLVDTLLKLHGELGGRPVLILTDELSVNTVSGHRAELLPYYRFRLPSAAMVDTLSNKAAVQRFAEAHDLPVPRTVIVERESDLTEVPALGMPVIIKPADKQPVHMGLVGRVFLAATMRDVTATCQRLLKIAGPLVVQEWIDGPDSNIYFALFHCGASPASRAIFFGRKLAARPRRIGSTAVCVPAPEAADLLRPSTEKFLDVSEYQGLGSLEFKRDPRTQRFLIIEPTVGRTDSQEEIAALNGLNLPLITYRHELGLPATEESPHNTAAWRESFLHIGRSSGLRTYDGYWRADDPLPALAFGTEVLCRAAARLLPPLFTRGKAPPRWRPVAKQARRELNKKELPLMTTFETIIIGAGPYGLSVAAHLRSAAIDHAIIGAPMESWRKYMPAEMVLKSERFASNLSDPERRFTLEQYCAVKGTDYAAKGSPLPIGVFLDYADWFQRQAVPDVWNAKVRRLRWTGSAFELILDDRTVLANRVIVATGHLAFRYFPEALESFGREAPALVSHAADHSAFEAFNGRDVTVVGSGQSGLETAALLAEQGANVRVIARTPAVEWNPQIDASRSLAQRIRRPDSGLGDGWRSLAASELPRVFFFLPEPTRRRIVAAANGPSGAWWLKNRVVGKIPLLTSSEIVEAGEHGGRLRLSVRSAGGTKDMTTDHVIAGTGYRVDIGKLPFLDPALRAAVKSSHGAPVLNRVFESSVPRLHFVGLASAQSFGPVMRFVYGAKHPAAILASHFRSAERPSKSRKGARDNTARMLKTIGSR